MSDYQILVYPRACLYHPFMFLILLSYMILIRVICQVLIFLPVLAMLHIDPPYNKQYAMWQSLYPILKKVEAKGQSTFYQCYHLKTTWTTDTKGIFLKPQTCNHPEINLYYPVIPIGRTIMSSSTGYGESPLQQQIKQYLRDNQDRGIHCSHFDVYEYPSGPWQRKEEILSLVHNILLQSPDLSQSQVKKVELDIKVIRYAGPIDTVTPLQAQRYRTAPRTTTIIFRTPKKPKLAKDAFRVVQRHGLEFSQPLDIAYTMDHSEEDYTLRGMHLSLLLAAEIMYQIFIPSFLTPSNQIQRAYEAYGGHWQAEGTYRRFITLDYRNNGTSSTGFFAQHPTTYHRYVEDNGESSGSQPAVKHERENEDYEVLSFPILPYSIVSCF